MCEGVEGGVGSDGDGCRVCRTGRHLGSEHSTARTARKKEWKEAGRWLPGSDQAPPLAGWGPPPLIKFSLRCRPSPAQAPRHTIPRYSRCMTVPGQPPHPPGTRLAWHALTEPAATPASPLLSILLLDSAATCCRRWSDSSSSSSIPFNPVCFPSQQQTLFDTNHDSIETSPHHTQHRQRHGISSFSISPVTRLLSDSELSSQATTSASHHITPHIHNARIHSTTSCCGSSQADRHCTPTTAELYTSPCCPKR